MRFLFKQGENPRHIYVWTEVLASRPNMVECDSHGNEISASVDDKLKKGITPDVVDGVTSVARFVPEAAPPASEDPETVQLGIGLGVIMGEPGGLGQAANGEIVREDVEPGENEAMAAVVQANVERAEEIRGILGRMNVREVRYYVQSNYKKKLPAGISKLDMVELVIEMDRAARKSA